MRLTLFWRVILAQSALIALVLLVGLYARSKLEWLTRLDNSILTTDSTCIDEEKRLRKTFLGEMRNAEKHLVSKDKAFYDAFVQGSSDFSRTLAKIAPLMETLREKELVEETASLHVRYIQELNLAVSKKGSWEQVKTELGDGIIERINELVSLREQSIADKTAAAHEDAASATMVIGWLTLGGIVGAFLFAFFHARGVSAPLKRLAREMRHVGRGEFSRSLDFRASKEVHELALAFNRMAEELAELDKLKADFTAHVSHELRTPLTAIREGTALLLEEIPGPLVDGQREILEVVRSHSERLFRSISSLLDLSKMEAEMMEYELAPCDLATLLGTCVHNVELIARKRRIDLELVSLQPLPLLFLDERRIAQVIDNLLSNALKLTPEGGKIRVSASVQRGGEGDAGRVEVRVSDTGQGILPGVADRMFESFVTAGKKNGTGLGLAIVKKIVDEHGGNITFKTKPGKGTTFEVRFPAGVSAD